ncbi:MAG TPA: tyrosine-type recombinase/integrase [Bacillota bacterium]|nr:tyrosine-type recombinase/integrase [Bacillota bacterium]
MSKRSKIYRVEPLRTTEEIEEMKWAIRRGNKGSPKRPELAERDVLIFLMGINTGLRVNDLVRLKVGDVKEKSLFVIREGKTDKRREINIGMLQDEIEHFIDGKPSDDYLFKSQKGNNHITTTQVYRILNDAADLLGRDDIGTHTMRKTFGYHHYKRFRDVAILQEIFNHAKPSVTMRYIGIRQDEINESLSDFRLG